MNVSLTDLFHSMGWFAKGIVAVLMIMSIFSLTIMIQKWWNLLQAQKQTRKFAPEFSQFLEEDNLGEADQAGRGLQEVARRPRARWRARRDQAADPGWLGDGRRHQLGGACGRA